MAEKKKLTVEKLLNELLKVSKGAKNKGINPNNIKAMKFVKKVRGTNQIVQVDDLTMELMIVNGELVVMMLDK